MSVVPPGEGVMAGLAAELQAAQLYSEEARTAVALRRSMQDMEERWAVGTNPDTFIVLYQLYFRRYSSRP